MKQKTCAEILAEIGEKIDKSPVLKAACIYSDSVKKPSTIYGYGKVGLIEAFKSGAEWQAKQSSWISVNERLPEENENVIIMCEHGAIFNGTYCNGVWFCMDGYLNDTFRGDPIYSSVVCIPPLWKPVAWMPIPKFNV